MSLAASSLSQEYANLVHRKYRTVETRLAALKAFRTASSSEVAKDFKITERTLFYWKKRWNESRQLATKTRPPHSRSKLNEEERQKLIDFFIAKPGSTNAQAAAHLDQKVHPRTISRYLKRAGFSRKKFTDE